MNNFFEILDKNKSLKKPALVENSKTVSYKDLFTLCRSLSSFLASKDIKTGDRIGIFLPNSIEFAVSFFACLDLGAIAVPINPKFKKNEIQYYLTDSGPKLILTSDILKTVLMEMNQDLENKIVGIKGDNPDIDIFHNSPCEQRIQGPSDKDTKAIYLYSTGSTGVPKRVSRTHKNLISLASNHSETVGLDSSEKILFTIPISHTYALGNFVSAIKSAMTCNMLEDFNRKKVAEIIVREKITIYPCVPFILDVLAQSDIDPISLKSLKLVISAGAPLSKDVFNKFSEKFKIQPRQLYGSSETGVISINLSEDIENTSDSVGRPVKGVTVRIIKEDGREAKTGELGEITVKSATMTTGYNNMPEETKKVFKNGFYYTGDLGYIDEDGMIYIKGRKKLMINISGNKVDPVEIENLLSTHPKIEEAAVVGLTGRNGNEFIKAFIVCGGKIEKSEIIVYLKNKITDYKIPKLIEFVDIIPKSPTGKILRNKLT
ncbi:MAG: acyl--CoA ligase [Candidatus Dadabacteria bacterium]|nr:acyl--CoA ligase [Candidatus Dadabacteria bacterium]NIS08646.1 acyl--CoA ligase [Candidatus Dadabacteria bacterium]NIV42480.1 AMP-binding protein [Candidatus Dadabacteria bacterium]NIX15362.1 AMP-binding protein [Candidatus Dadabacteria bacterium]NIY22021.1 AMP-binding protein [Candidatus Dadabacteria bacterium]